MSKPLITKEERELFRSAVERVTPLSAQHVVVQPTSPSKPQIKPNIQSEDNLHPLLHKQSLPYITPVDAEQALSFFRTGLQARVVQRLKRGEFAIDAVLDLHGFNSQQAEDALQRFLNHALQQHWRCVQIIHGKGARSQQAPVLKNNINQWLRAYPAVLAFCSAQANDGGVGAVYVLLKGTSKN